MSEERRKSNYPQLPKRVKSGNIHVYFRGNSKNTVFYNDTERIEFLKKCNSAAKKHKCKILAFVLMDNHVHMQVKSEDIVSFVKTLLIGYVQWYNIRNGLNDKLFKTPFGSSCKYTDESIVDSIMYILSNPVRAGIVSHAGEYIWSSYDMYFNSRCLNSKYIEVDTDIIRSIFKTKKEFETGVRDYTLKIEKIRNKGKDIWPKESYVNIMKYLKTLLKGRSVYELSKEDRISLIIKLRNETGASYWHIASLMHESYTEVRRILLCQSLV